HECSSNRVVQHPGMYQLLPAVQYRFQSSPKSPFSDVDHGLPQDELCCQPSEKHVVGNTLTISNTSSITALDVVRDYRRRIYIRLCRLRFGRSHRAFLGDRGPGKNSHTDRPVPPSFLPRPRKRTSLDWISPLNDAYQYRGNSQYQQDVNEAP